MPFLIVNTFLEGETRRFYIYVISYPVFLNFFFFFRFTDTFNFLISLPKETHIWCGCWELMGPLLETFHNFNRDGAHGSPLILLWTRISQELRQCTQCVCQHHQAQEAFAADYEFYTVGSLLKTLRCLDEQRVVEHIKEINAKIVSPTYDPECYGSEVVSIMFEVCECFKW